MIRTTRQIIEVQCKNCKIVHLLGEKFNGKRCCDRPEPRPIGKREVVEYKLTIKEQIEKDKEEVRRAMRNF